MNFSIRIDGDLYQAATEDSLGENRRLSEGRENENPDFFIGSIPFWNAVSIFVRGEPKILYPVRFKMLHADISHLRLGRAMRLLTLRSASYDVLLASVLVTLQLACDTSTDVPPPPLADVCQIHLGSWFSHTPVKVAVDNSQVFADTVTTGSVLAFAAIIPVQVSKGTHGLNVTIVGSVSKDTTFTIADTLYIGVNYNATSSRISYALQRQPFYYR
jgi:hypothetical protein